MRKPLLQVASLAILSTLLWLSAGCGSQPSTPATATSQAAPAKAAATAPSGQTGKTYHVGIMQIVQHPNLDAAVKGAKEQLAQDGFVEGKNVVFDEQNAQNEQTLAKTIADKFVADKVDVIIGVSTPASQAAAKATKDIPVVYVAVTDAVAAGLIPSTDKGSGNNVTGVYNFDPVGAQMDLAKELVPNLKTVGVIYNAGESNSVATVNALKATTSKRGWGLAEATVASTNEVRTAAQSLVGRADVLYMPTDNTVVSALEALVKVSEDGKLPLIVGDISSVERGALATYGDDPTDKGRQAGALAAKILKGTKPGDLKSEEVRKRVLYINKTAAQKMGVTVPDAVLKRADKVIE